jgi:hypothetical protein
MKKLLLFLLCPFVAAQVTPVVHPGTANTVPYYKTPTSVDPANSSSTINLPGNYTVPSGASLGPSGSGTIDATAIDGVTVTGTPTSGQVPTATSGSAATWQTPSASGLTSIFGNTGPTITALSQVGADSLNGVVTGNATETVQQAMTAAGPNGAIAFGNSSATDVPYGTTLYNNAAGADILKYPFITTQTNGSLLCDYRWGVSCSLYNPLFPTSGVTTAGVRAGFQNWVNWNQQLGNSTSTGGAFNLFGNFYGMNVESGTQNWNQNGYANKSNVAINYSQLNAWSASQVTGGGISVNCFKRSGDCIPGGYGVVDWGNLTASSDEGAHAMSLAVSQGYVEYLGTTAAASVGATSVTVTASQGGGTQASGGAIYDITKAYTTGTLTSITGSTGLDTVTGSSTAWTGATFGSAASTTTTTSAAITVASGSLTPGSVNIQVGSSSGFSTSAVVCVADTVSFEYVLPTAVPDGTHITATFLQPHASGATMATGGLCGYGLNVTADNWTTAGSIGYVVVTGTLRQIFPIVSSSSATAAIVWISGGVGLGYDGQLTSGGAYSLFPMTLAVDGANQLSSTIPTMPLAVAFTSGDTVAEALNPNFKSSGVNYQFNRFFPSPSCCGSGLWGGQANGVWSGNDVLVEFDNNTAAALYNVDSLGGALTPPLAAYKATGVIRYGLFFGTAPSSYALDLGCPPNGCANGRIDGVMAIASSAGFDTESYDSGNQFWTRTTDNRTYTFKWDQSGNFTAPGQLISSVAIGTAPLVVTSTTNVANLNASSLSGNTLSAPTQYGIAYGSTSTNYATTAALTANALIKAGSSAAPSASSVIDNGTTVTSTDTGGYVAPVFVANGTTAGFIDLPQGSTSSAVAPCNAATSICIQAPTSVTSQLRVLAGAPATGFSLFTNSSGTMTETISATSGTLTSGVGLWGTLAINTVLASTVANVAGHFTNLQVVTALGGTCTTAPIFNVFDGTSNTGSTVTASSSTQTKGTGTSTAQTQTFAAGDVVGIYISTAGGTCTTDQFTVTAQYSIP